MIIFCFIISGQSTTFVLWDERINTANKKTKFNWKMLLNITGGVVITGGAATGLAFWIKASTEDNAYKDYEGDLIREYGSLTRDENGRFVMDNNLITRIRLSDGMGHFHDLNIDRYLKLHNDVVNAEIANKSQAEIDALEAEKDAEGEKINKEYIDLRKASHTNWTLSVDTKIFHFDNDYFDVFAIEESIDFIDFFVNDIAWGPDLLNLVNFKLERGIPKDGGAITLGGHSGTREKSFITFYPDAFFKAIPMYDSTGRNDSILVDLTKLTVSKSVGTNTNSRIIDDFTKDFTMEMIKDFEKLADPNFDNPNDPDFIYLRDKYFNYKTWDDQVKVYSVETGSNMMMSPYIEGPAAATKDFTLPGGFTLMSDFNDIMANKGDLPVEAIVKDADGTVHQVRPWEYMRRVLMTLYLPIQNKDKIAKQDKDRKHMSDAEWAAAYPNLSDGNEAHRKEDIRSIYNPIYYTDAMYPEYISSNMKDKPLIRGSFRGFAPAQSKANVQKITQLIYDITGIKPYNMLPTTVLDYNGETKVIPIFEKYLGVIETFEDYYKKYGWSPVDFSDVELDASGNVVSVGKVDETAWAPIIYLAKFMPRTTTFADSPEAHDGSLTQAQIDEFTRMTSEQVGQFGIEWLKYVTSHEYGHQKTIQFGKNLSDTTTPNPDMDPSMGIYSTDGQIYSGAGSSANYERVFSREFVNAYLLARTGRGGNLLVDNGHMGIDQLITEFEEFTAQVDVDARRGSPFYRILHTDGSYPVDSQGNPLLDRPVGEYADFKESWRGFKTIQESTEDLIRVFEQAYPGSTTGVLTSSDRPSNLMMLQGLLNSIDRTSYSITGAIATPQAGFRHDGSQQPGFESGTYHIFTPGVDSDIPIEQSELSVILEGWHSQDPQTLTIDADRGVMHFTSYFQRHIMGDNGPITIVDDQGNPTRTLSIPGIFTKAFVINTFDFFRWFQGDSDSSLLPVDQNYEMLTSIPGLFNSVMYGGKVFKGTPTLPDTSNPSGTYSDFLVNSDPRRATNWVINVWYDENSGRISATDPTSGSSSSNDLASQMYSKLDDIGSNLYGTEFEDLEDAFYAWFEGMMLPDPLDPEFPGTEFDSSKVPAWADIPIEIQPILSANGVDVPMWTAFRQSLSSQPHWVQQDVIITSGTLSRHAGIITPDPLITSLGLAWEDKIAPKLDDPQGDKLAVSRLDEAINNWVRGLDEFGNIMNDENGHPLAVKDTDPVTHKDVWIPVDSSGHRLTNINGQPIDAQGQRPTHQEDVDGNPSTPDETVYDASTPELDAWAKARINYVYGRLMEIIVSEANLDDNRYVTVDVPLSQGAAGEQDFIEWLSHIHGVIGNTPEENARYVQSYASNIYQMYYTDVGRFLSAQPSTGQGEGFYPTGTTVLAYMKSGVPLMNEVYMMYIGDGAYPYFGQLMGDYQQSLTEMLTRDWNQLVYSPSQTPLQQGEMANGQRPTEMGEMSTYAINPIYVRLFTENGPVTILPWTGSYNPTEQKLYPQLSTSGFFEDVAYRSETDSSLYDLDHDTQWFKDEDGDGIADGTSPTITGHLINHEGKALVNFFRESFGISPEKDVNEFYLNQDTGFGYLGGFMSVADSQRYHYLAIQDRQSGEVSYIPIDFGYGNEFFNQILGASESRTSMLDHYYDLRGVVGSPEYDASWVVPTGYMYNHETGLLTATSDDTRLIGWTSAQFLMYGFGNAIVQPGHSYNLMFSADQSLSTTRNVQLGYSLVSTHVDEATGHYVAGRRLRHEMVVSGFDTYSGVMRLEHPGDEIDGQTILRVVR